MSSGSLFVFGPQPSGGGSSFDGDKGSFTVGYSQPVAEDGEYFLTIAAEAALVWRTTGLHLHQKNA